MAGWLMIIVFLALDLFVWNLEQQQP